jgi:hypothetical protein
MFLTSLQGGCLPQSLPVTQGRVACTVYVVLTPGESCASVPGLADAPPDAASAVRKAGAPSSSAVCVLNQLPASTTVQGSCAGSQAPGWCYVSGAAAGNCPQTLEFTIGLPPNGAEAFIGCN